MSYSNGICGAAGQSNRLLSNKGPNAIWHMDSCAKLKPYGIEINGSTDGFNNFWYGWKHQQQITTPRLLLRGDFFVVVVNTPLYSFQRCENDACSY